jgi:hypothetical protein
VYVKSKKVVIKSMFVKKKSCPPITLEMQSPLKHTARTQEGKASAPKKLWGLSHVFTNP